MSASGGPWRVPCCTLSTMNHRVFVGFVSLGSGVAACGNASPASSAPDIQLVDAGALPSEASVRRTDVTAAAHAGHCDGGGPVTSGPAACITIDLCNYDLSCTSNADCMMVTDGLICASGCQGKCPNAAINVKSAAQYQGALARLGSIDNACECGNVLPDYVGCVSGFCTYCGPPGCPDAAITGPAPK